MSRRPEYGKKFNPEEDVKIIQESLERFLRVLIKKYRVFSISAISVQSPVAPERFRELSAEYLDLLERTTNFQYFLTKATRANLEENLMIAGNQFEQLEKDFKRWSDKITVLDQGLTVQ